MKFRVGHFIGLKSTHNVEKCYVTTGSFFVAGWK